MQTGGSWAPDPGFGSYNTAVDTRSLSISLFQPANGSSSFNAYTNPTTNVALLYYENSSGKVSALLYRLFTVGDQHSGSSSQDQWVDITSQESKELPHEFRNAPGFNYSNSFFETGPNHNTTFSHTLYETDPIVVYSTPFTSSDLTPERCFTRHLTHCRVPHPLSLGAAFSALSTILALPALGISVC